MELSGATHSATLGESPSLFLYTFIINPFGPNRSSFAYIEDESQYKHNYIVIILRCESMLKL